MFVSKGAIKKKTHCVGVGLHPQDKHLKIYTFLFNLENKRGTHSVGVGLHALHHKRVELLLVELGCPRGVLLLGVCRGAVVLPEKHPLQYQHFFPIVV